MMNIESKSKWQIRLATLSIFLLGFIAGAIALNAYHLWFGSANQSSRRQKFEDSFSQLNLNENQKIEVQRILTDTREKIQKYRQESEPRMQDIRAETDEKLQRVLTPEQWTQFQQERDKILQTDKPKPSPKPINIQ